MTVPREINHTIVLSSRFQLLVGRSDLILVENHKIASLPDRIKKLAMAPPTLDVSLYIKNHMKYSLSLSNL